MYMLNSQSQETPSDSSTAKDSAIGVSLTSAVLGDDRYKQMPRVTV